MKIKLSIRIIALFTIAILSTLIPEYFNSFFGDYTCNASQNQPHDYLGYKHFLPEIHWGKRHFLFSLMSITLFCIQVFSIIDTEVSNK